MPSITVTVKNRLGLHARAASAFVKISNKFQSQVTIQKDGQIVNGKSILGIMTLAAHEGTQLTLKAEGIDAEAALQALSALVEDNFGEEAE